MQKLARELDTDPESARAGVACLLEGADFSASADVERVLEHQVFHIFAD